MREKLRQNIHGVRGCEGCLEGGDGCGVAVGTGRGPRGMGGMIEQQWPVRYGRGPEAADTTTSP